LRQRNPTNTSSSPVGFHLRSTQPTWAFKGLLTHALKESGKNRRKMEQFSESCEWINQNAECFVGNEDRNCCKGNDWRHLILRPTEADGERLGQNRTEHWRAE